RHAPQYGNDHVVEREHRRGRKSRQDDDRLAVAYRQAERLAGLQRHAMGDDARLAQPADDAMADIARPLGRTARQDEYVMVSERIAHRGLEPRLIVGESAEKTRFAAVFGDRGADDGTIGV